MYIPSSFFSSQGACISASVTYVTGSGSITSGSFVSGGVTWDYYQFANTKNPITSASVNLDFEASLNILSGSTGQAKLFLVAGGGAGGYSGGNTYGQSAAGGGGGGGIVYYNQFPLSIGSYNIKVGIGGGNPLNSGIQGRTGNNSTFTYNIPYSPFTSSVITAYGGGKGGYVTSQPYNGAPCSISQGVSGGSAGGAVCCFNQDNAHEIIQAGFDGFGGLNGANQGNDASGCVASTNVSRGSGGGGAGTIGAAATGRTSTGGDGAPYTLTGNNLYYAAGGGGAFGQDFPIINQTSNNGNGSAGFGNGGQGQTLSYSQGTTATNGVVIIAIPNCASYLPSGAPGLWRTQYNGYFGGNPNFFLTAQQYGTTNSSVANSGSIAIGFTGAVNEVSCEWKGYFKPQTTENYTFFANSDDAMFMWIGDDAISNYTTSSANIGAATPGPHDLTGSATPLISGISYPMRIQWGENFGDEYLNFQFQTPTISKTATLTNLIFNSGSNGF
jgi:hypothetical protein